MPHTCIEASRRILLGKGDPALSLSRSVAQVIVKRADHASSIMFYSKCRTESFIVIIIEQRRQESSVKDGLQWSLLKYLLST